jgi:uncharacterized protein (TIRG00374 family)
LTKTTKNILRYALFIAIAAILLYFAFRGIDFNDLMSHLKHANYWWVGISVAMGFSAVVSRGYRWLLLLEPLGYKPRLWSSIHAVSFGYMFNIFVPRGGELGRCGAMSRAESIPVDRLFGTVILERVIDFVFLIVIVTFTFLLNITNFLNMFETQLGVEDSGQESGVFSFKFILFAAFALVVVLIAIFRKRIINHPRFEVVRNFWKGIVEGFKSFSKMEHKGAFLAHSIFIWVMYFFMVYICFFSLPETAQLTISDGFFVMVAASLGIVIPAPGGMGSYHYLVTLALVVLGLDKASGLSFATIVHTSQTAMLLAAGLIALVYFSLAKKRKANEPDKIPEPESTE